MERTDHCLEIEFYARGEFYEACGVKDGDREHAIALGSIPIAVEKRFPRIFKKWTELMVEIGMDLIKEDGGHLNNVIYPHELN